MLTVHLSFIVSLFDDQTQNLPSFLLYMYIYRGVHVSPHRTHWTLLILAVCRTLVTYEPSKWLTAVAHQQVPCSSVGRASDPAALERLRFESSRGTERSGFEPWPGHCVVFLGKILYSHSASLYTEYYSTGTGKLSGKPDEILGVTCDRLVSYLGAILLII